MPSHLHNYRVGKNCLHNNGTDTALYVAYVTPGFVANRGETGGKHVGNTSFIRLRP